MNPAEEIVVVVDRDNKETGVVPRGVMRAERLIHRASYILVFNKAGELFMQKRTMTKDVYPGYYDIAAGGVVLSGESYEESARRELREELGVEAELREHFDHYYEDADNRVWGRIFSCAHEGPFTLQVEEVESGEFMEPADILKLAETESFTPDGLEVLKRLVASGF